MGHKRFLPAFCRNPFEARRRRKNSFEGTKNRTTQEIIKRGNCQKIMIYARFSNLFLLHIAGSLVPASFVWRTKEGIKKEVKLSFEGTKRGSQIYMCKYGFSG